MTSRLPTASAGLKALIGIDLRPVVQRPSAVRQRLKSHVTKTFGARNREVYRIAWMTAFEPLRFCPSLEPCLRSSGVACVC